MTNYLVTKNLSDITKIDNIMLVAIAVLATVLLIFVGYKLLQMLQLTGYKLKGYFMWFKETKWSYYSRLFMLTFLTFASILVTNVLLEDFFTISILKYVGILFFFLFSSLFITNLFTAKQKTPLKYTKRMTRFVVIYSLLILVVTALVLFIGFLYVPYISYGLISIVPLFLPIIVILAYFITLPFENLISNSYIKRAKKKLSSTKNIKVIGITGSYGKTSIKNILGTILSEKYKVCATPSSYNTPLWLAKTILSNLEQEDEIFIAEMGARQQNDINELCEMVNPKIGIITGVGNQHLLTFGSEENIIKTKAELAEYITKNSGDLFVNVESKNAKILANSYNNAQKININDQNTLKFEDIKTVKEGSSFVIKYNNETYNAKTILLGEHNISNIYLCSCVALSLGLSINEIVRGIEKLVSIPHRLEIIKSTSTYTIIDDSYNSSVEGSKASLNVLSKFDSQKFVITPGLVELGKEQFNANFEFGRDLAKVCDYVIIDSAINYNAISSGLIFANFNESKIIQTANLNQAVQMLNKYAKPTDVVLFENDLPDNYN